MIVLMLIGVVMSGVVVVIVVVVVRRTGTASWSWSRSRCPCSAATACRLFIDQLGMIVEQIEAFDVDEQRAVVGRAGRFEHAHHVERVVLVRIGSAGRTVGWPKQAPHLKLQLPCDRGADDGAEKVVRSEDVAFRALVGPAIGRFQREHLGGRADDAELVVIVAQAARNGLGDVLLVLALAELLVIGDKECSRRASLR